jgi:hypothetical protein
MMARVPIDPLPETGPAGQADDATGFVERNREVIRIGTLVSGETWKDHRRRATDPLDDLGTSPDCRETEHVAGVVEIHRSGQTAATGIVERGERVRLRLSLGRSRRGQTQRYD